MYRTLALAAALAPVTGCAPALRATARSVALKAKYTDANGNPIKAALSAYMHFCNDERATVTAEQKRLAGDSFKQTLVMTKLGALWRELPEAQKATYNQKVATRCGHQPVSWVVDLHAIEAEAPHGIERRSYGVEARRCRAGVGRPKFDFHTQATYNAKAKEDKARYDAALKAAGVLTKAEKKAQGPKRPLSARMHFLRRAPAVAHRGAQGPARRRLSTSS